MCIYTYNIYIYVYTGERRRRTQNTHSPICPLNHANLACHRNESKIIRGANALCNPLCQKNSTLAMPHRLLMISLATSMSINLLFRYACLINVERLVERCWHVWITRLLQKGVSKASCQSTNSSSFSGCSPLTRASLPSPGGRAAIVCYCVQVSRSHTFMVTSCLAAHTVTWRFLPKSTQHMRM